MKIKKYWVGLTHEDCKNEIVVDGKMPKNEEMFVVTIEAKSEGEAICKALAQNPYWEFHYFVKLKTLKNTPLFILMYEMLEKRKREEVKNEILR